MAFLANFALFFVFFLPLTLAVGVPFDFYVGRYQPAEEASQLFYWILLGWPLFPIILQRVRGYGGMPEGYCQDCGYNLTGNVSGRCPECGLRVPPDAAEKHPTKST